MNKVLSAPWCHGEITQEKAQSMLMTQRSNTFLVRFSLRSPLTHPFTISRIVNGIILHQRIARISSEGFGTGQFFYATHTSDDDAVSADSAYALIRSLIDSGYLGMPCPKNVSELSCTY